mmetsp:Transcript_87535/g.157739  ORF Transcript_87535/g.157739 Transcript_87535/m.157739 type:complete len:203 (-) Transcript_87535:747-1355(-)
MPGATDEVAEAGESPPAADPSVAGEAAGEAAGDAAADVTDFGTTAEGVCELPLAEAVGDAATCWAAGEDAADLASAAATAGDRRLPLSEGAGEAAAASEGEADTDCKEAGLPGVAVGLAPGEAATSGPPAVATAAGEAATAGCETAAPAAKDENDTPPPLRAAPLATSVRRRSPAATRTSRVANEAESRDTCPSVAAPVPAV